MKRSSLSRVGAISHVSCIDRRLDRAPEGGAKTSFSQLESFGLIKLQELCGLLEAQPVRVMARCSGTSSEVFLELTGNVQIQYSGMLGASHAEQSLWVEGPRGSVRAQGALIWWRKRGWPKFLPWGLQSS